MIYIKHLFQNEKYNKWGYVQLALIDSVRKRYSYGLFIDSVFAATNILISRLKSIIKYIENQELNLDGADLIGKLFSEKDTKIYFSEIDTVKGREIQKGYVNLFRGWLSAIRNRDAHPEDYDIDDISAFREITLISMLLTALDNRKLPPLLASEKYAE